MRSLGSIQEENFAEGRAKKRDNESLRGSHGAMRQEHKEPEEEDKEVEGDEAIMQQEEFL